MKEYVVIDIHQFIFVNDAYGHNHGDKVIEETHKMIASYFKDAERTGGNHWTFTYDVIGETCIKQLNHLVRRLKVIGIILNIGISTVSYEGAWAAVAYCVHNGGDMILTNPAYE